MKKQAFVPTWQRSNEKDLFFLFQRRRVGSSLLFFFGWKMNFG